jgi:hypothetical protein
MPDTTTLKCGHQKYLEAGWQLHCNACGFDNLAAAELTTADRREAEDFVPLAAVALWTLVAACEELVAVTSVHDVDCAVCAGGGCERCGGLGFIVDARLTRALQAVLAAGRGLCTDDGHERGCSCGGDLVPARELAGAA